MKFIDFLKESEEQKAEVYKTKVNFDDMIEKIKKEYDKLPALDEVLFRGMTGDENAYLLNANARNRTSGDTSNHYTIIFDEYLKKKNLPLRSRSLICSTKASRAREFNSNLFVIIPVNKDSIVGVVNKEDIWDLKLQNKDRLRHSVIRFNDLYSNLGILDNSFDDIAKGIEKNITPPWDNDSKQLLAKYFDNKSSIKDQLLDYYDLEKLGATFETIKTAAKKDNTEVWISDKAYAINYEIYEQALNK